MHKSFGEGVVLNYEGSGEAARVQINFDQAGTKWLVMGLCKFRETMMKKNFNVYFFDWNNFWLF
jgi:hypothetical protein